MTALVCVDCGHRNEAGERFCASCGAFLAWSGDAGAASGPATSDAAPGAAGPLDRPRVPAGSEARDAPGPPPPSSASPRRANGAGPGRPTTRTAPVNGHDHIADTPPAPLPPARETPAAPRPAPPAPAPAAPADHGDQAAPAPAAPAPAGAVAPAPADPPAPADRAAPQPVQPGEAVPRRPVAAPAAPTAAPGGPTCRACGTANDAGRRFCARCGAGLAAAAAAGRLSWWRRLRGRGADTDAVGHELGHRRALRRGRAVPALLVLLLAVAAVAVLGARRGWWRSAVDAARELVSDRVPVTPSGARASSSAAGTEPRLLYDGATNRYWAPVGGAGEWAELRFAEPTDLREVIVHAGVSDDKVAFLAEGRPRTLVLTFTGTGGRVTRVEQALRDAPGDQSTSVEVDGVLRLRLTVGQTYGMPPATRAAIGEVEFYARP
ncbi:hypothetical protein GCM10010124_14820 [Pilimelia terevasa]|uniref:Zinc ribbon domain-containing protein n=1 Tax=Pilimelia terevasa TaxID=53372 RepID=A0A8J3BLK2_9ACTN|nr:zinc ribbon domain-containing protein [Pilimelia terevasa]GGK23360.1 hypothetical protein GCM10010124_14820 [Pilimelia terevasa]